MEKRQSGLPVTELLREKVTTPLGPMSVVEAAEAAVAFEQLGASNMASMFRELLRGHLMGKGGTKRRPPTDELELLMNG